MYYYRYATIRTDSGRYFGIIVRNTEILYGDNNRIMKILMKRYYCDINIIAVLNQKPPDFIV